MYFIENRSTADREGVSFYAQYREQYDRYVRLQKQMNPRLRIVLPPPMDMHSASSSSSQPLLHVQPVLKISNDTKRRRLLNEVKLDTHLSEFNEGACDFIVPRSLDKFEACHAILRRHGHERNLIFINCAQAALRLCHLLEDLHIKYCELKGSAAVVTKRIKEFTEYKLNVLILNAQHMGAGLNIPASDTIILVHTPTEQIRLQLIGRRQRPSCDKTRALQVFELKYCGPSTSSSG
jgi:hypothetical protein